MDEQGSSKGMRARRIRFWKFVLLALCLGGAALNLWSMANWHRYAVPENAGGMGVSLGPSEGNVRVIVTLKPESDLAQQGAKEGGKMRVEGKEYVMHDGDVVHFRFNV